MKTYESLVLELFEKRQKKGIKLGLEGIRKLLNDLGNPHLACKYIHVAGTNGKGSVCTKVARGLRGVYSKVGLYTSPHIVSVRERIQINGQQISKEDFTSLLSTVLDYAQSNTLFETLTALAFLYFAKEKTEIVVLETGLGGRLDATNVVLPELSIITSISLEHTSILGDTEEKIAREKAGIMKENRPVVLGPGSTQRYLSELAEEKNCSCICVESDEDDYNSLDSHIAFTALSVLGIDSYLPHLIDERPSCRFEKVYIPAIDQECIFDVAHNPDGIRKLLYVLTAQNFSKPPVCILGVSEDKDLHTILGLVHEHFSSVVLVTDPALPFKNEQALTDAVSLWDDACFFVCSSVKQGVEKALLLCSEKAPLVITGSFYLMGPVKAALGFDISLDELKLNEAGLKLPA